MATSIPTTLENDLGCLIASQSGVLGYIQDHLQQDGPDITPIATQVVSALQTITRGMSVLDKKFKAYRVAQQLSHVSCIFPKTKTVVFAGSGYLGDNIKYAYLSFLERARRDNINCYFLPSSDAQYEQVASCGVPCLPSTQATYDPASIDILLSAKVLVVDNHFVPPNWQHRIPYALLAGAKTIQLWHGIPIKKIGLETVATGNIVSDDTTELYASCGPFDLMVGTSALSRTEWKKKFSFHEFAPLGYPRNDVFFRDLTETDRINVDLMALEKMQQACQAKRPVLLYAPTYRDHQTGAWFTKTGIVTLANYCAAQGYLLYVNLHPVEQSWIGDFRKQYPMINFVAPHTDVYPLVKYTDVLITDYSSLAFDFLLLDRPILFYRPDHDEYITRSRHLIQEHEEYVCGKVSTNSEELICSVEETVKMFTNTTHDSHHRARHDLCQKLFDHHDGFASQRLGEKIVNLLGA